MSCKQLTYGLLGKSSGQIIPKNPMHIGVCRGFWGNMTENQKAGCA
ncbi:MAG: hypothetical protein Q4G33_02680 [bacterium]|nr:hypothetical protein [bacterium]